MENEALQSLVEKSLVEMSNQLAGFDLLVERDYIAKVLQALAEEAFKEGFKDACVTNYIKE